MIENTDTTAIVMPHGIEAMLCTEIAARQARGMAKYGTSVADNPLTLRQWLQHAMEEALDQAVYLRRAIAELDAQAAPYIGPDRRKGAAAPATAEQSSPDADGWIKWEGGRCPVTPGTLLDVRHRSGFEAMRCRAGMSYATRRHWLDESSDADIIAYRLSKEASQ